MLAEDIDAAWLPEKVNEWRYVRMRTLFEQRKVKGFPQETLLVASQKHGVVSKETYGLRTVVAQTGLENLKLVEPGDFVISLRSFQGGIEYAHERGIISPAYTVLRLHNNKSLRYFGYLLKSTAFLDAIKITVTGIREGQNIDYSRLGRTTVPVPPMEVQSGIVRYLDHADVRIAKAIQAKQKMVALLNEQKQVIISELVTHGLNPDVPMKNSGQAWLGQIPAHWDVVPVRATLQRNKRVVGSRKDEFQLLSLTKQGVIVRDLVGMKGKFPASFDSYQEVNDGDFIFCMFDVDETPRAVGRSNHRGMITGAYDVFTPTRYMDSNYLLQQFLTFDNHKLLKPLYRGLRKTIPMPWFLGMKIACPPTNEQVLIAESIVLQTESIDRALHAVEREIELLKEYRTVLISDVVTGKKDVRAEAADLPDVDPAELAQVLSGAVSVDAEEDEDDGTSEVE